MRRTTIAALAAFALLATLVPARAGNPRGAYYSPDTGKIFCFVHFSDTHIGVRGTTDSTRLKTMVTTVKNVIAPNFMVVTGDLTDSTNGSLLGIPNGPYQAEWDQYKSLVDPYVDASTYYDLPGNHDAYSDRYFAYYRANSVQGRAHPDATQFSWTKEFSFGKYHFMGINSCDNTSAAFTLSWPWGDYAGLDTTELAFINDRLNDPVNLAADLTFVFGHHPVTDTLGADDTWLFYGYQEFVGTLDSHSASLYGYGHTHRQSDVQFIGDSYTLPMANGGMRYVNIASTGKSASNQYDVVAVDCNGVSSVPATIGTWPVVLITAPVASVIGGQPNPYAYTVPADSANPVRALVFDAGTVSAVQFRVDTEATWHPMTRVATGQPLWQGTWNASTLAVGNHTLTVQETSISLLKIADLRNTARAAEVAGDFRAVMVAAYNFHAEHERWPADGAAGAPPAELVPFLPGGFRFTKPEYTLDFDNLGLGGGASLIGVTVSSSNPDLMTRLIPNLGSKAPYFAAGGTLTYIISERGGA